MRRKVSVKIFVILMSAFMIILVVSMKINIDAQSNLYKAFLSEQYRFNETYDHIREYFPYMNDNEEKPEEITKKIETKGFKKNFNSLCEGANNFVFLTTPYENPVTEWHQGDDNYDAFLPMRDTILDYTLDKSSFDSDYIYIYGQDTGTEQIFSVKSFSETQKASLLSYIQRRWEIINQEEEEWFLEYSIKDNQLVYLKWDNNSYGTKTKDVKKGIVGIYNLNGKHYMYDFLRQRYDSFDIEDMKYVVENYIDFSVVGDTYGTKTFTIGDSTFFIMTTPYYWGEYQDRVTFIVVNVVHDLNGYVIQQYIEQNTWLYVGAFMMAIVVSWLFSYMIAKPIRKVEKAALKIASQDFDEPLIIKSKDEIGLLAKSVDSMRVQLKETIENLQQEIDKVKNLESLRKDFINQFTHEMKTPLGIINGYSELIEESKNEEEVNKYLNIINRETNRVNELIQSMLKLSRLEAKKVELNKQDIDLEESVVSIVDEYEVLLMKKNIKVEVNVVQSTITADKKLIETVIHNFLSNAIKHTDENHKIIIDIDNGVSIFNEGKPIDDEKVENIWYTFVTHDREGSGLGLAICRSILDLHEFKYGVNNKENGVCFWFKVNELFI